MNLQDYNYNHKVLSEILTTRSIDKFPENEPLWKLKLSASEYESLKLEICNHIYNIQEYGLEAALCYAEWWRRDYSGNIPSKEDVALSIGISVDNAVKLFDSARNALKKYRYKFIHSQKGTEYFRTLLNQGGLPIAYIKRNDGGLGAFSRFLAGLVRELSALNYDWNNKDYSMIHQFNCISYLGKTFKNDNIYDVALQIAHAIILDDNALLPYDDTDTSLSELTKSLKREYSKAQRELRVKPLSLHWKLHNSENGIGHLFFNMDVAKDISSDSIPRLNISTCYSFDVFVAGILVGKYVRKSVNRNDDGDIENAIYTRISVGINNDILWKGEPVIEVKVRCDNDDRLFITISGCYPPNFDTPQVFQMLDEHIWAKSQTANTENNIVIFDNDWETESFKSLCINDKDYRIAVFSNTISLYNANSQETINLTNEFTQYITEFSGNYISWVEASNCKLLSDIPIIRVYDKVKNRVQNIKTLYKVRKGNDAKWKRLNAACRFPIGLIDIKVEYPDGHYIIETFYAISGLCFSSTKEQADSTEIICYCDSMLRAEIEQDDYLNIEKVSGSHWKIKRKIDASIFPSVCSFRFYNYDNPTLRLSVAIPFDGILITDVYGNALPNYKTISFANLNKYYIISHNGINRYIDVSYTSDKIGIDTEIKSLRSNVIDGRVSLSDYHDLILRMFNLYGADSFNRTSSVVLNIYNKQIFVRYFVLDSTIKDNNICITDTTDEDTDDFRYSGSLYSIPVDESLNPEDFYPVEMIPKADDTDENIYCFPEDYPHKEVIVFSGSDASRRIVPKCFNLEGLEYDESERMLRSARITQDWIKKITEENVVLGDSWKMLCKAFEICSNHNIPFTTYNGLKAVCREPKLLVKFILAMWINEYSNIIIQDIDRFEQELVIAIHWIPQRLWQEEILNMIDGIPVPIQSYLYSKMDSLIILLISIFNTTLSMDIASMFTQYISSGKLDVGQTFYHSDIRDYKTKIHGLSDTNKDLPVIRHNLQGRYYQQMSMLAFYRVMIESAMCAAENTACVDNCTNLFSREGKENARIINFYRRYFKETYSDIFFRTLKYIVNPKIK